MFVTVSVDFEVASLDCDSTALVIDVISDTEVVGFPSTTVLNLVPDVMNVMRSLVDFIVLVVNINVLQGKSNSFAKRIKKLGFQPTIVLYFCVDLTSACVSLLADKTLVYNN